MNRVLCAIIAVVLALTVSVGAAVAAPPTPELRGFRVHRQGQTVNVKWDVPYFNVANREAMVIIKAGDFETMQSFDPLAKRAKFRSVPRGEIEVWGVVYNRSTGEIEDVSSHTLLAYQHKSGYPVKKPVDHSYLYTPGLGLLE